MPLKIRVGDREFVDNSALDVDAMMDAMHNYNGASTTACPSPEEWAEKFMQADNVLAITISSSLSGSYNSAMVAREMVLMVMARTLSPCMNFSAHSSGLGHAVVAAPL